MKAMKAKIDRVIYHLLLFMLALVLLFDGGQVVRVVISLNQETVESSAQSGGDPVSAAEQSDSGKVTSSAPPDPAESDVGELLEDMTLEEKIYQLFIVTPEQLTSSSGTVTWAGTQTQQALAKRPVGGIVYFSGNIQTREQVSEMIENSQSYASIGLFIAVDEEGGSVARVGNNSAMGTTAFPDMGQIATVEEAYQVGATIGTELRELGFNLDFAPVADVNSNPNNPVIGTRAFSADPEVAADLVAACVSGFKDSGLLCTLKHFPGHGDTSTDSHTGMAETDKQLAELETCELIPFARGIETGADLVMVGHITLPAVTGDAIPACLSPSIVTGLLRETLGFDGLIVSDSMQMAAITDVYGPDEAAVMAIQAGVDLLLMPEDLDAAVQGLLDAVDSGILTEERIDQSVERILAVKQAQGLC